MNNFIKRLSALTCGQVLAMSLTLNVIFIVVAALIFFQPTY